MYEDLEKIGEQEIIGALAFNKVQDGKEKGEPISVAYLKRKDVKEVLENATPLSS